MAVCDEDIQPTIEIVVVEEASESQGEKTGSTDFRSDSFIDKEAVSFVVIQGKHFVGKVGDQNAGIAGSVVVRGGDAHSGSSIAQLAVSDTRHHSTFREGAL